jgi:hypothetical protein
MEQQVQQIKVMKNKTLNLMLVTILCMFVVEHSTAQCDFVDSKTGNRYIGECTTKLINGKEVRYPDGKGTQINSDGSSFVGIFSNAERVSGTYYFDNENRNNSRIENAVYENDILKSGVYIYASGAKYEGTFKNDKFDGEGVYFYRSSSNKIRYEGSFAGGKFNGQGTLYYKDGSEDSGLWKDDVFMGAQIGVYQNQPVIKKGDTVITRYNDKQYLLSQQAIIKETDANYGFIYPYGSFYVVYKDIQSGSKSHGLTELQMGNTVNSYESAIGYIPVNEHKFHELICNTSVYDKFIQCCDWEICRMENTSNAFKLSYAEYNKLIKQDIDLNNRIMALKAQDIIIQVIDDKLGDMTHGAFDFNTSVSDFVTSGIVNMTVSKGTQITGAAGNCFASVKKYVDLVMQNNPTSQLHNKTIAQLFDADNRIKDLYTTELGKLCTEAFHSAYDVIDDCSGRKLKGLMVLNMMPELSGIIAIGAANLKIVYSLAPEYRANINTQITKSTLKKQFIQQYKLQYQNLIGKCANNCMEYTKVINTLRSECFNPFGEEYKQEVLTRMKDYVFGEEQIGKCTVLTEEELKGNTQKPVSTNNNIPEKRIIGYYGAYDEIPVYLSDNSIIVKEKVYPLYLQPLQQAFNNDFTQYNGDVKVRYFIMYSGTSSPNENDYHNENLIGWVDWDYKNKYTFTRRKGNRVEGVNLFGSLYIGPNNPVYPHITSPNDRTRQKTIYTLPCQDNVDVAALEHDKCYEAKDDKVAGLSGALFNTGVVECDVQLVRNCLTAIIHVRIEDDATESAINYIKDKLDWTASSRILDAKGIINHMQITDEIKRAKYVATFFLAASSGKGWGLIYKNYVKSSVQEFGEREFQKSHPSYIDKQTVTYTAPTLLTSTSGEQYEAQAGYYFVGILSIDGKIEHGHLYNSDNEIVKTFFVKK